MSRNCTLSLYHVFLIPCRLRELWDGRYTAASQLPLTVSRKTLLRPAHQAVCVLAYRSFPGFKEEREKGEEAEDSSCAATTVGRAAVKDERKTKNLKTKRQEEWKESENTHGSTQTHACFFITFSCVLPFGELKFDGTPMPWLDQKLSVNRPCLLCLTYCVRSNNRE